MRDLLTMLVRQTPWNITAFASDSGDPDKWKDVREKVARHNANAVSSNLKHSPNLHSVMLDLDVPAYLVPSSTPGHSHLYIDVEVPQERYFRLLDALADCGVIERGYANASKEKGGTFLRLPWVKKEGVAA